MFAENRLSPSDFIWHLFVTEGEGGEEPLQTLQPLLVPFFASRARPGQPSVLGPFGASPPTARVAALQLLARQRMQH